MGIREKIKERVIREFFKTHSYRKKNVIDELVTDRPFDFSPAWEKTFFEAMRHSFRHHCANSEFYRRLCRYKGFDESKLQSFGDIWDIPYVMSDVFKRYFIQTKTGDMLRTELSSSGTSGRKSKISLDMQSGRRLLASIYHIYNAMGLISDKPANYLLMTYNPELDASLATTNSDVVMTHLTRRKEIFYALDSDGRGQGPRFLKDEAVEKLKAFVDDGAPVRMLGFVHHACEVIKSYAEKYGKAPFPKESYILTGGGWKGGANPYGPDFTFHKFLAENTTIDMRNVRDLYTLNEHMVFYLECDRHNMHVPNVALACSRSPRDLRKLADGDIGLLHLYSPIIESCPALSLLTTDYGYVGRSCPCRLGGPYLKVTGRAGVTKKTTCAFTADQYVREAVPA